MKYSILSASLFAAATAVTALSAQAQDAYALPLGESTSSTSGGATDSEANPSVHYVTGGIGDDERQAIEAAKAQYNVHITNASINGAFVEETQVLIKDKSGAEELNISTGPLLYVQLPAGSYQLTATHGNESKTQKIVISKKKAGANIHFGWKVPALVTE